MNKKTDFKFALGLPGQVLLGLVLGVMAGVFLKNQVAYIKFIGDAFILLLKMIIAPVVFLSVLNGMISIGDLARLSRISIKTIIIYIATMGLAVINGLVLVNLIQPGVGADIAAGSVPEQLAGAPETFGAFFQRLMTEVLKNPFAALANTDVLAIIAFAMLFGIAIVANRKQNEVLIQGFDSANTTMMWLIEKIILLSPYAVFALIANIVAESGLDVLFALGKYMATVLLGLAIHAFVIMTALVWFLGKINPIRFWKGMSEALGIAFSSSSSAATLPVSIRCVEKNLGVSSRVTGFVLPLGTTINMNGTALYEAVAALFIAQAYHVTLSIPQQILIFITAIAAAIGAPGIPSAGLVTMALVLKAVGLPLEGIGLILSVDRFLDMCRTTVNVADDAVAATIVDRTEPF